MAEPKEPRDWQTLHVFVRERAQDKTSLTKTRLFLNYLTILPRTLNAFLSHFVGLIKPLDIDETVLWGLVELNTIVSPTLQMDDLLIIKHHSLLVRLQRHQLEHFNGLRN